jgi:sortase A
VAEAPGADGPLLSQGNLPTRLVIPSAGVDTPIVEVGVSRDEAGHASWETAWRAAGHHLDSARPGQPGNMVITGHVSVADRSNVAVFKSLESVKAGDVVEVSSGDTVYHYRVSAVSVAPANAVSVLKSGHQSTLTLITCTRDLKYRVVVTGTLVDAL